MLRRTGWLAAALLGIVLAPAVASAQPMPGECASGFCGTPNNNGGGCGCGCGGSILVNNTDLGQTYSTSDDYDADGIEDDFDNCPFIPNRDQADSDGDGIGNVCDNCATTSNRTQADTDGDGQGNACDSDSDGDAVADASDNCPLVPNKTQVDTDGDGQGDVCDADKDADGIPNTTDPCPLRAGDAVGAGEACDADQDADGVPDSKDNCPAVYNPDQKDADNDSTPERPLGDACDGDQDNDSVANEIDNCPEVANPDQKDDDHDGLGNLCDTDGYCFHAAKNPAAKCLDPRSYFQVTASKPPGEINTGDKFFLGIYSNRATPPPEAPDATTATSYGIKYSFAITKRPEGSQAKIENPVGPAETAEAYEYRFDDSKRPAFVPDLPGSYEITLAADLTKNDDKYPGSVHAQDVISVMVTGQPKTDSAGCASVPPIVPPRAGALLGLSGAFLLGLVFLGRRRSRR